MKRIFKIRNLGFILIFVLINMIMLNVNASTSWTGNVSSAIINRTVTNVYTNPTVTYTYTVTADSSNPGTATGTLPSTTISFPTSATFSSYTSSKSGTLLFSGLSFSVAGDYKYAVVEATNNSTYPRDTTTYYIYISVENVLDANDHPTGNTVAEVSKIEKNGVKYYSLDYTSSPSNVEYVEIKKQVTGSGANVNQYFMYELEFSATTGDATYVISGLDTTVTYNGTSYTNPTTVSSGGGTRIYLKSGQTAIIGKVTNGNTTFNQIPVGTHINYYEYPYSGYTKSCSINNGSCNEDSYNPTINATHANNIIEYTNTKTDSEWGKTGVLITTLPYIIIIAVAIIGLITYLLLKNKNKKEEVETI